MVTEVEILELARQVIVRNRYMTLATVGDRKPWIAPLFFAVDSDYRFYFQSMSSSLHARHIRRNPNVALTIFDSQCAPDSLHGVQVSGIANEVGKRDVVRVMLIYFSRRFPTADERNRHQHSPNEFIGGPMKALLRVNPFSKRFYRIVPNQLLLITLGNTLFEQTRIIDLNALRHRMPIAEI